jgi:hypothetical protein
MMRKGIKGALGKGAKLHSGGIWRRLWRSKEKKFKMFIDHSRTSNENSPTPIHTNNSILQITQ